jgi:hypothetical protein
MRILVGNEPEGHFREVLVISVINISVCSHYLNKDSVPPASAIFGFPNPASSHEFSERPRRMISCYFMEGSLPARQTNLAPWPGLENKDENSVQRYIFAANQTRSKSEMLMCLGVEDSARILTALEGFLGRSHMVGPQRESVDSKKGLYLSPLNFIFGCKEVFRLMKNTSYR